VEGEVAGVSRQPRAGLPRKIWVLVGISFVIALGYGVVAPVLPTFARSFNVGITAASIVVSAFALLRIAFAPLSSRWIIRMGELRVFCAGLAVVGVSSLLCAVAADYWQLLAFRAAGGIGSTMFTVSAASLLVRISPPDMRGRAAGAWSTGFLLGNVAGPVFGGLLAGISMRAPFVIYAGLLLASAVTTYFLLRGRIAWLEPQRQAPAEDGVTFRALIRHRPFKAAVASNLIEGWLTYGVGVALVPLFVGEVLRESAGWAGGALAAFAAGTAATVLVSGVIADRWGRKLPILVGSVLVAFASGWLGFSVTAGDVLAGSLMGGIGAGLISTPVNALVADLIAQNGRSLHGSAALAGFQMVGDVGAIIGPVAGGLTAELFGYRGAFLLTGLIALATWLTWVWTPDTAPDERLPKWVAAMGQWRLIPATASRGAFLAGLARGRPGAARRGDPQIPDGASPARAGGQEA
jgi:MFS family permease